MRLNRKIEKRDLGMEGGDETLRARARRWRDVRTGVYMLVLQNFSRFFCICQILLYLCGVQKLFYCFG